MKFYIKLFAFAAMSAVFFSCVDDRFDLSKVEELDQIVIGQGIAMPVGDATEVKIDQLLSIADDSYLKISEDGDYYLELSSDEMHFPYEVPNVEINVSLPDDFFSMSRDIPLYNTAYESPVAALKLDNIAIKVDETKNIPSEIQAVDHVSVTGSYTLDFARTDSESDVSFCIQEGFIISFPEWLFFDFTENETFKRDGNKLISKAEMNLDANTSHLVKIDLKGIDFKKLPEGQGLVSPGHLLIDDNVTMDGKIVFKQQAVDTPRDASIVFMISSEFSKLTLNEITGTLAPKIDLGISQSIDINGLPSVFEGDDVVLDMADFLLYLNANNNSPFSALVSAELSALNNGTLLKTVKVGSPEPIEIVANSESNFLVSESGVSQEGYKTLKIEGLTDLLSKIPATLKIDIPSVNIPSKEVTVNTGDLFDFSLSYKAIIPFAFGKNLNIRYSDYIENLNVNLDSFTFTEAELSLKISNTTPLEFTIDATIVDAEKNPVPGISVEIEGAVAQGSMLSPSTSDINIHIKSEQPLKSLDGLSYTLKASSPSEEFSNISLNKNQGLRFHDMKLKFNEGFIIDMNNKE